MKKKSFEHKHLKKIPYFRNDTGVKCRASVKLRVFCPACWKTGLGPHWFIAQCHFRPLSVKLRCQFMNFESNPFPEKMFLTRNCLLRFHLTFSVLLLEVQIITFSRNVICHKEYTLSLLCFRADWVSWYGDSPKHIQGSANWFDCKSLHMFLWTLYQQKIHPFPCKRQLTFFYNKPHFFVTLALVIAEFSKRSQYA